MTDICQTVKCNERIMAVRQGANNRCFATIAMCS